MPYRIQHRETGCWLVVDGTVDAYVGPGDIRHATKFRTVEEARQTAMRFSLKHTHYKITNGDNDTDNRPAHPQR